MYAVGHLALGYLTGKATSKVLGVDMNIPLLFFTSIVADADLLIPFLEHRGPTHSLVIYALIFLPFAMVFGKKSIVYFVSLFSHALLGDLVATGGMQGVQILWPLSSSWYVGIYIPLLFDVYLEWAFFLLSIALMLKMRDFRKLFEPHPLNLLLTIPVFAIILPVFFGFPLHAPLGLFIPHLAYLAILAFSILKDFKAILTKKTR